MSDSIDYRKLADVLAEKGALDAYSIALPRCMDRFAPGRRLADATYLLAALVAEHTLVGKHDCLDLSKRTRLAQVVDELPEGIEDVQLPKLPETVPFPLVAFGNRLYLERYMVYERRVADALKERAQGGDALVPGATDEGVVRETENFRLDTDQKNAIAKALAQKFTVITGGPGTGKTTILCAILVALKRRKPDLRIFVCAPTGKAQARMMEAIKQEFSIDKPETGHILPKEGLPLAAELGGLVTRHGTIHRLLGWRPGEKFAHNRDNPLEANLVVVDEVSMADVSLMAKLLDAVPKDAGIILMGDKDQLSSVETGAVLADIFDAWKGRPVVAELKRSHRFKEGEAIARIKSAMNDGDADKTVELMRSAGEDVRWFEGGDLLAEVDGELDRIDAGSYLKAESPKDALEAFERFRIICAERKGSRGVAALNAHVQAKLGVRKYAKGYPLLVTENATDLGLFNGDVLVCWPDETDGGRVRAWILDSDGSPRSYPIAQLPEHSPAFAMTIHKSQGSGFDHVLMVLPNDVESPLLTRELVYTGLTRTKKTCRIWASEAALRRSVTARTIRDSGLAERLG